LAVGGDISRRSVLAAQQNLANLKQPWALVRWDANRLPLPSQSVDKASVNLPFGKQIGSPAAVRALYPRFFAELERVLKPGGSATVLSSEYELVKDVLREDRALRVERGYSVAVLGQWGRLYILQRL
jgi:23S rRNA G2445 N2-methylase RlmL